MRRELEPGAGPARLLAWDAPFLPDLAGVAPGGVCCRADGVPLRAARGWPRGQRAAVALQLVAAGQFLFERGWYPERGLLRAAVVTRQDGRVRLRLGALPSWRIDAPALQRRLRNTPGGDAGVLVRLLAPLLEVLVPECRGRLERVRLDALAWEVPGAWVEVLARDGRQAAGLEHPAGRGRALWARRPVVPAGGVFWLEEPDLAAPVAAASSLRPGNGTEVVSGALEEADVARAQARAAAAGRDCLALTTLCLPGVAALPLDGGAEGLWVLSGDGARTAAFVAACVESGPGRTALVRAMLEAGAATGFDRPPPASPPGAPREALASAPGRRALAWLSSVTVGLTSAELEALDAGAAPALPELERLGLAFAREGRMCAARPAATADRARLTAVASGLAPSSLARVWALAATGQRLDEVAAWCEERLEEGDGPAVLAAASGATSPALRSLVAEAALGCGRLCDAEAVLGAVGEAARGARWHALHGWWAELAGLPAAATPALARALAGELPARLRARCLLAAASQAHRDANPDLERRLLGEAVALSGPAVAESAVALAELDGPTALRALRRRERRTWRGDAPAQYLHRLGLLAFDRGAMVAAATALRAALRVVTGHDLRRLGEIHTDLGTVAIVAEQGAVAERHLQLAERWLERCGSRRAVTVVRHNRAVLACDRLDWRTARELVLAGRELRGAVTDRAYWLEELELARAELARGQAAGVEADLRRLEAGVRPHLDHTLLAHSLAGVKVHAALGRGDLDGAGELLAETDEAERQLVGAVVAAAAGTDPPPGLPRRWGVAVTAGLLARVCRGEDDGARDLAGRALAVWPRETAVAVARLVAILGRRRQALPEGWNELLGRAGDVLEQAGLDGWVAVLRPGGGADPTRAVAALDEILHAGSDGLAAPRLETLARALGLRRLELRRGGHLVGSWGVADGTEEELSVGGGSARFSGSRDPLGRVSVRLLLRHVVAEAVAEVTAEPAPGGSLLGSSAALEDVRRQVARLGPLPLTVLVLGEAGTGKELVARELHRASQRRGPFQPVNCAGIQATLLEAELFGVVRGAYTGADRDRTGLVEAAEGGTLFLDEIGELPLELQGKLLRLLQEREVRRVGATKVRTVDVRFVAATNRDLSAAVADGRFREDLYYRLAVAVITVPPLRDRPEDVTDIASRWVAARATALRRPGARLSPAALDVLRRGSWPGNVRELESAIDRALASAQPGEVLGPDRFVDVAPAATPAAPTGQSWLAASDAFRRAYFERLLAECGGNRSEAARRAGISRQALHYHLRGLAGIRR